jgi:NAD(P)-dependent dehydrogenase (short-subunit alcohol dehydrogenase family)
MLPLDGQVALVTGASKGIGSMIARTLAQAGAVVVGTGTSETSLDRMQAELGPAVEPLLLDVGSQSACLGAVRHCVDRCGRLDVLVNNAGIAEARPFLKLDAESWQRIMRVDVEGPLWLTQAALPGMLERGSGAVISIASSAARIGMSYLSAYGAAKHALLGLTRSWAAEFVSSGVTFNCVCPHYVDTPMTQTTLQTIEQRAGLSREDALALLATPQGRLIQPEEVAAVCLLLASAEGRSINGQAINIDGGLHQA